MYNVSQAGLVHFGISPICVRNIPVSQGPPCWSVMLDTGQGFLPGCRVHSE